MRGSNIEPEAMLAAIKRVVYGDESDLPSDSWRIIRKANNNNARRISAAFVCTVDGNFQLADAIDVPKSKSTA